MPIDILIHKNTYTKIQSALTYGFIQNTDKYTFRVENCHNSIFDLYYLYKPKNILLQIEEYSNEFHTFVSDTSIDIDNIFLTIDNNKVNFDTYIKILQQIRSNNVKAIAPTTFIEYAQSKQMNTENFIPYHSLINKYVFFNKNLPRNNKTLCILSSDKNCVASLEKFLYPASKMPIVMINNPEVKHDQNIGLMLDDDLNTALNSYGSVIDLTEAYDAEIAVCGVPKYNIQELENLDTAKPSIISIDIEDAGEFITSKLMTRNE
jgi:hypothetical protein